MTAHAAAAGTTDRQDMEMPPDPPTDMPPAMEGGELFVQPTDEAPKMDEVKAGMIDGAESGGAPPPPTVKHYDQSHPKPKPKPLKPTWKAGSSYLQTVSELTGKCFDFPISNFNHNNNIVAKYPSDPTHFVGNSDAAVDFKLSTFIDGDKVVLSELLQEKPVLLLYGMYTCPAFQGYYSSKNPSSHMSKYDEYALVEKYKDQVSFVHLYGPEPHPKRPDKNFDTGKIIEFPWSTVRNAKTWDARRDSAMLIKDDLHPESLFVLDNLGGPTELDHGVEEPPYNPVWCTYGPGARQAFLIGKTGRIYDVQAWFHASTMAGAIEELMLLEQGLVDTSELESFRQARTDQHQQIENDISSAIESAFVVQEAGIGEQVGDTLQYDQDRKDVLAEQSKARVLIDQYTSSYVADIYDQLGASKNGALDFLKVDPEAKLKSDWQFSATPSTLGVAGLGVMLVVAGLVVRSKRRAMDPYAYEPV